MIITVVYTNIGRHKGCKTIDIEIASPVTREKVEKEIATGAREFLVSECVTATEHKKNKFKIYAGFQIVGTADII